MKNETPHLEQDLGLSFQDRIDILYHEIELAVRWDRPSILFAIYRSDAIRDEVNTLLKEKLNGIAQRTHFVKTNHKDQFDFLAQIPPLPELSQTVLLIDGFNWECGKEGVRVFKEFNKHREYFIDNNIRAIFWLFENEVSDFAANATECWILRHRMVEFVDIPHPGTGLIQSQESLMLAEKVPLSDVTSSGDSIEKTVALRDGEKVNASHANGLLSLGILFWRKGNPQRALKYLQASAEMSMALSDHSLQAQCQNALALVQVELGNIEGAVSAYQSAISLSPESGFLWNNLGQTLAKNEMNEEAIKAYQQALLCSPQDFLSWDGIGHLFLKLGAYQNAISAFEKALEIAPYYEFSWAGLGNAYLEAGQLEKVEEPLRKAVELNVQRIDAWLNLGKCFTQQDRGLDAIAVYHRAIEFNPQNADIWDELGKLHLQMQNYSESILAFQKAISLNPQDGEKTVRLAYALFQIGDYETSASVYEGGIPLFNDAVTRAEILNRLGDTYLQMKNYEKAIAAYEQSEQLSNKCKNKGDEETKSIEDTQLTDPTDDKKMEPGDSKEERGEIMNEANHIFDLKSAAEWNEHGNSHLKAGAYNDAIVAFTKAIEMAPDACWPYIQNLAHVHYQKGKAIGKQTVGITEDPDLWEGEEDVDPASLNGYDTVADPKRSDANEEPGLEKLNRNDPLIQSTNGEETEKASIELMDSAGCCLNENPATVSGGEEKVSRSMAGAGTAQTGVPQNTATGAIPSPAIPGKPQFMDETPQNSIDWNDLGNMYTNAKKFDNAIEAYKKAIEMNPKYGQPYTNLGFIYYRLAKYEVAVRLYQKSIDLLETQEDKAISWNRLGDAYRRLGDYGNALAAYQNASEMAPVGNPVMARARATLLANIVVG